MQVYLGDYCLNGFGWRKAFVAGYMVWNLVASREEGEHNKNNVEYGGNALEERDWYVWLPIFSHRWGNKVCAYSFVFY